MPPSAAVFCVLTAMALAGASCVAPASPANDASQAGGVAQSLGEAQSPSAAAAPARAPSPAQARLAAVCAEGQRDVNVTVVSAQGPLGGAPTDMTHKLFSMNVDDQRAYDYVPSLNPNYTAFLAALKPALLRWPSGFYGQTYQFTTTGSGAGALTPDLIDGFMALCHAVGAKPLMAINTQTGSADNAAKLVQFVNKDRAYKVAWWQIGNEPDVDGVDGVHNPNSYADTFKAFQTAMLAVDSTIKCVGAELFTGANIMGGYSPSHVDWLTPILEATQSAPMDAVAWHYYPLDSSQTSSTSRAVPSVAHALQESAADWPPSGLDFASIVFPKLKALRARLAPKAELWVDEFAEDSGVANGAGIADRFVGALWAADALGRFAEQGADAVFRYTFKGGAEHKYSLIDESDRPRPEYYSYWLYAQHFGDRLVRSSSDQTAQVAVHASLRAQDHSLRLMLINKTAVVQRAHVALQDFMPVRARKYELVGTGALSTDVSLNASSLSMANIGLGEQAIAAVPVPDACLAKVLTLPPLSVTLLVYDGA